jgi:hypothetical protein
MRVFKDLKESLAEWSRKTFGGRFYPPNGKWLSPKFEKSEIANFRKQNEYSPK